VLARRGRVSARVDDGGTHTAHSRQIEPTKSAIPRPAQPAHLLESNSPNDPPAQSCGYIAAAASPFRDGCTYVV
jgi:hypothetical protein